MSLCLVRRSCAPRTSWRHREVSPSTPRRSPNPSLRIGFYSNHLCERGSEVALFDYADFAEKLRGAVAFILYDFNSPKNVAAAVEKFCARFGERVVPLGKDSGSSCRDISGTLDQFSLSHVYIIKYGHKDEPNLRWFGSRVRTLVHAVFDASYSHGDVYARISPCVPVSLRVKPGHKLKQVPVVPHIVRPCDASGSDLRRELGIPADATVFGRHGGADTFDIPEARAAVLRVARQRRDIFFVLMNTREFIATDRRPPNIIHVEATACNERKAAFVRTCDAMLHARLTGETFGLAIGEFSACNKPVLTSRRHTENGLASFHIQALGSRGLFYHDQASCEQLLLGFDRVAAKKKDWNAYRQFEPAKVMAIFWEVFIDGRVPPPCAHDKHSAIGMDDSRVPSPPGGTAQPGAFPYHAASAFESAFPCHASFALP